VLPNEIPVVLAIQRLAVEQLHPGQHLHPDWPLLREYPLSSELLVFSQLWCDGNGRWQIAAKGAPEAIAQLCHLAPVASGFEGAPRHPELGPAAADAPAETVHDYLFEPIGLLGLADPLRPEVAAAIARARAAGVRVVMITGDAPLTARSIAEQAGLPPGPVLCAADLERLTASDRRGCLQRVSVFARVLPHQKLQLVQALQAAGEVVAMGGGARPWPVKRPTCTGPWATPWPSICRSPP